MCTQILYYIVCICNLAGSCARHGSPCVRHKMFSRGCVTGALSHLRATSASGRGGSKVFHVMQSYHNLCISVPLLVCNFKIWLP